jgi:hypothetical protein
MRITVSQIANSFEALTTDYFKVSSIKKDGVASYTNPKYAITEIIT